MCFLNSSDYLIYHPASHLPGTQDLMVLESISAVLGGRWGYTLDKSQVHRSTAEANNYLRSQPI